MEVCPACGKPLVPFRAKLVCRTPGCGFMESCCDGGWMHRGGERVSCQPDRTPLPMTRAEPSLSADPPPK